MRPFDPSTIFREELGELRAYAPTPGNFEVRLDANEAPDLLSSDLKKRLAEVASRTEWQQYPDAAQRSLRKQIGLSMGLSASQIIVGDGSDEIITMLLTAATRLKTKAPSPTLVTTTPTFVMYRHSARIRGQRVMEVPLDSTWDIDESAMLRAIEMADPNLIFIASPNNPTGNMVDEDRLKNVIEAAKNSLVIVDEAYIDYADRNQQSLLEKYENVAIMRTLSKIGFASLRVGWLAGSARLIAELDKVRLPYNIPTVSQSIASVVLSEFGDELQKLSTAVKEERARVALALDQMTGVTPAPSQANFLWLELEQAAGNLFSSLGKKGVLVRSFHGRGGRLEKCLRVTIGSPTQNDRFLSALSESL